MRMRFGAALLSLTFLAFAARPLSGAGRPVTPDPSPEAAKLLQFLYSISGKHTVRPTDDEPVTFRDSVQGRLTDQEWQDLVTPGTALNERWKSLALDVYQNGFSDQDYQKLLAVAGDKPIALGEVGVPPSPEILGRQPRWTWFMSWGDASGAWRDWASLRALYESEVTLTLDELPWVKVTQPKIHHPVLK